VAPDAMPAGAIYNSNRFFLRAMLQRLGCEVTDLGIVPDKREATIAALRDAAQHHDLILTSGGVSVGEEDHIKPAVESLGELKLWQLAIKPGKPFAYGKVNRGANGDACHFMGLPGNPVSSFVTFLLLVRPFVLSLQGVTKTQGGLDLFPNQSSGVLTSAVWGDGVVDNPAGQTVSKGDTVRFISFAEWLA
jgi:molybdopterin molybdotransferase